MRCPYCGNDIDSESIRCMFCGMLLPEKEMPKPSEEAEETPVSNPVSEQLPESVPQTDPVDPAPVPIPSHPVYSQYANPEPAAASRKISEPAYDPPLSIGGFLGTILVSFIPVVGLIMLIIWASVSSVNTNRRNLSVVLLILKLIFLFFLAGAALAVYLLDIPSSLYIFW